MKKSRKRTNDEPKLNLPWDKKAAELEKMRQAQHLNRMTLDEYFEFLEAFTPTREELMDVKIYKEKFKL